MLDLGHGFGKYCVLCRKYLELWDHREDYKNWVRTIDAIEAFEDYITVLHKFIYDSIFIGDAYNLIESLERYDLTLLIDVLEHFEKDKGRLFISKCLNKADSVLISTPKHFIAQEVDFFGNEYEHHKSLWTKAELKELGYNYFVPTKESYVILISNNKKTITNNFMIHEKSYWIYQNEILLLILRHTYRIIKKTYKIIKTIKTKF